jgi:hypothetical protein
MSVNWKIESDVWPVRESDDLLTDSSSACHFANWLAQHRPLLSTVTSGTAVDSSGKIAIDGNN